MNYLTPQQTLAIHDSVIKRTGGSQGIRDVGLLESAVFHPQASFEGEDLYVTIFEKAAALLHSLLKNHPFVDGNKRTALSSAGLFLLINGYRLTNVHEQTVAFTLQVENATLSLEQITKWLKKYSKKMRSTAK